MPRKVRIPSYGHHKSTDQAVVLLDGRSIYLGRFGTPKSRDEYRRVVAEWLSPRTTTPVPSPTSPTPHSDLTVAELCVAYWRHVTAYYVKDGEPTSAQDTIRQALRFLRRRYGSTSAAAFVPLGLQSVRDDMVRHPVTRKVKVKDAETGVMRTDEKVLRLGLTRDYINKQVGRIRAMYKWAVSQQLVPVQAHQALCAVADLRKDHTTAREKPPVGLVPPEHVEKVMADAPPAVRAMIELQFLCGGRPQDVVLMRAGDIDASGDLWAYHPDRHKSEHRGRGRVLYLGPKAQALLRRFLAGLRSEEYVFSPRRAEAARLAALREERGTAEPCVPDRRKLRDRYDAASYRRAVRRSCERLGIPNWFPLQLRHNAATLIRRRFGLEAAQSVLGHAELSVTQVYAERHENLAREVMAEIG